MPELSKAEGGEPEEPEEQYTVMTECLRKIGANIRDMRAQRRVQEKKMRLAAELSGDDASTIKLPKHKCTILVQTGVYNPCHVFHTRVKSERRRYETAFRSASSASSVPDAMACHRLRQNQTSRRTTRRMSARASRRLSGNSSPDSGAPDATARATDGGLE